MNQKVYAIKDIFAVHNSFLNVQVSFDFWDVTFQICFIIIIRIKIQIIVIFYFKGSELVNKLHNNLYPDSIIIIEM